MPLREVTTVYMREQFNLTTPTLSPIQRVALFDAQVVRGAHNTVESGLYLTEKLSNQFIHTFRGIDLNPMTALWNSFYLKVWDPTFQVV